MSINLMCEESYFLAILRTIICVDYSIGNACALAPATTSNVEKDEVLERNEEPVFKKVREL